MRIKAILLVLISITLFGACTFENGKVAAESNDNVAENLAVASKSPVLVELFTSEGCSSCPPADRLLETIETEQPYQDAEVVTLALHVDYWDRLGWKDKYSSAIYSRRQDIYSEALRTSSVYTPQMVVDGRTEFVGSDAAKAARAISENARNEKARIDLAIDADKLRIKISAIPKHEKATIYLAFAESDLATNVERGENSGRTLKHISVVRELQSLGMLAEDQTEIDIEQLIQFQADWNRKNIKLVVFVQENKSRKIVGVGRIEAN